MSPTRRKYSIRQSLAAGLALLSLALILATDANANLITNGTFNNNADGWTSGNIVAGGFQAATGNPAGSFILNWFGTSNADPYIQQTINGLNPGQTYMLSWDLLHHSTQQTTPSFGAFIDPTDAATNPNGIALLLVSYSGPYVNKPWVSHQTSFVATAISHTIRFAAELDTRTTGISVNTDVSYYLDNVSLIGEPLQGSPIPEPASLVLLSAGLAGLLVVRRRPGLVKR